MSGHVLSLKKGASGAGAALLVLIIAGLLVLYVAFLPDQDQQQLLEHDTIPGNPPSSSQGYSDQIGTSTLNSNIGQISAIEDDDITHELNSFRLHTTAESTILAETPRVRIKNSAFQETTHSINFTVTPENVRELLVSYNVLFGDGTLELYFNGVQIYSDETTQGSSQPIELPKHLLKHENILYFSTTEPGVEFWKSNLFKLEGIQITGDIVDSTQSKNHQWFPISEEELEYFKEAELSFYPDCDPNRVGSLEIVLNNKTVFNGIPDCHIKNFINLHTTHLKQGQNTISFEASYGDYIIDQASVEVSLSDVEHPIYYFELDEDLFKFVQDNEPHCGEVDGECPDNCMAYEDKDCCFEESSNNYWCDMKTDNPNDRCVNMLLAQYTSRCPSGYEDRMGDPHDDVEGTCGDDTDGLCPANCDVRYDKDCCFQSSGNNYWCDDTPFTGFDSVCTSYVTISECDACPEGYYDDNSNRPNCLPQEDSLSYLDEPRLKAGVDVLLRVDFVDTSYKDVDFVINGQTLPVSTYNQGITRSIDNLVHYGTNSIVIKPQRDVTISQIDIRIQ
ncbi:MAG: hypothetical protein ACQESC_00565 [Nanobdellota archaeon]